MFLIDVTDVIPIENRTLQLTFADGLQAVINMDEIIQSYTGVFTKLQEDDYFRQVRVSSDLGTIVWPNGADVCPDVLYSFASGRPILINGDRVFN
jgi:hypothetical protein